MALVVGRSAFSRLGGVNCWLGRKTHPLNWSKRGGTAPIQVAGLKATYGEKYPYPEPWKNWQTRKYTQLHEWFDNTSARLNENSKVIIVDGNVAVGKNDFARRLAAGFDLKCIEAVPDTSCFVQGNGVNLLHLDHLLPESARCYNVKKFLSDPRPEIGKVGRLQTLWYMHRFYAYAHGLHHLLSTGQGFVMVRSPFTDDVFVEALRRMGYVTPNFMEFYYDLRNNSLCELLKPHICIYLDAPIATIRERIEKRANPDELASTNLSDKLLTAIDAVYKEKTLVRLRRSGHVIEIDWTGVADDLEMDVIIEELQLLDLEPADSEDKHCKDWSLHSEDMWCYFRKYFGSVNQMEGLMAVPYPWDCPEINDSDEDAELVNRIIYGHPIMTTKFGESPELGQRRDWWGFF